MDVFGALTAARQNRKAFTPFTTANEMKNNMIGYFDTRILIKFLADAAAAKVAPKKQIQPTLNIDEMLKSQR
jgi:HD-GYP domain-containing protein (c-di-GMP phosphodiesterase class II)